MASSPKVDGQIQESTSTLAVVPPIASGTDNIEISEITSSVKEVMSPSASGSEGRETIQPSPSLKEALLPVAFVTEEHEVRRATLNCMDILLPAYPWGPPGAGRKKGLCTKTLFYFVVAGVAYAQCIRN